MIVISQHSHLRLLNPKPVVSEKLTYYYTPRFNDVERGIYRFHLVRPSVRLSVWGHNCVRSVSSTILVRSIFIRPFEKRTYYAMAMSVRLSVRPSVRPSEFSGLFFQRALRYQFETWYMHSVGGTTCRV